MVFIAVTRTKSFGTRRRRWKDNIKGMVQGSQNTTSLSVNSVVSITTCFGLLRGHQQV